MYPWLESNQGLADLYAISKSADFSNLAQVVSQLQCKRIKRFPKTGRNIGYIPLIEEKLFTLCAFSLPSGVVLPLHNHPRQHVGLRVLVGELSIYSCDLEKVGGKTSFSVLNPETRTVTPDSAVVIVKPEYGNIHEIRAVTDSIFLDLVLPPYGPDRECTYYVASPDGLKPVSEREMNVPMELVDINTLISYKHFLTRSTTC